MENAEKVTGIDRRAGRLPGELAKRVFARRLIIARLSAKAHDAGAGLVARAVAPITQAVRCARRRRSIRLRLRAASRERTMPSTTTKKR